MATTTSPNMSLIVPVVSSEPSPTWASDVNASFSIIDQHNHSSGSGVQITQAGISLTGAASTLDSLSFNGSNAYAVRSVRFTAQASPLALATDLGCLYEAGVDLYYNDGSGNQVRITSGGSVAGATGTITGLPSGTASAAYSAGTFIFQSATSTGANIDGASYVFRNATASSFGLTLSPPNAMAANYSLTLPALPGSTSIMRLDSSGNMGATLVVDNSTIAITANTLLVPNGGITTTQIASATIVGGNVANNINLPKTAGGWPSVNSFFIPTMQTNPSSNKGLGIVRVLIDTTGPTVQGGEGITSLVKNSTGNVSFSWTTAFDSTPIVVATPFNGAQAVFTQATAISSSAATMVTFNPAGVPVDGTFSLIAIGEKA